MVGYAQVYDEEYDPNEDQDQPYHRGYHHHRIRPVWSVDRYTDDASIVARNNCTAHASTRPVGRLSACQHAPASPPLVGISAFRRRRRSLDESMLLWDSLKRTSVSPHYT